MTGEPMHTSSKEKNDAMCPSYQSLTEKGEVSITFHCQLCSTIYSITNKESTSAIKVATMKNTDNFRYEEEPLHATAKSTPFAHVAVSKDEWDTKEDTGMSMKNALYVRHMSG